MKDLQYKIIYETELSHWWYRVRRKILLDLMRKQVLNRIQRPKILDVGCGMGALLKELENVGVVHGVDISQEALDFCKKRGITNVSLGNITKIPYPDNCFDVVLVLDVLEHVDDDTRGIREMRRIVKSNGTIIVFVPTFQFLWGVSDELSLHHRRYTLNQLKRRLVVEGFVISRASYFNTLLFFPILFARLLVRFLKIPIESEGKIHSKNINKLLYYIFYFESIFLKYINFPFGVSALVVAQKR